MLCEWKHSVTPRLFHILHKIEGLHGSRFHLCRADETKVTESGSTPQLLMNRQTGGGAGVVPDPELKLTGLSSLYGHDRENMKNLS